MIELVTGGVKSGKSLYAEELALSFDTHPIYLATSRIWDEDHKKRIEEHKRRRSANWENVERETDLTGLEVSGRTVLFECVTLWLTNYFMDCHYDSEQAFAKASTEILNFINKPEHCIFVTNEIGMGVHAQTEAGRKFADIQGKINQLLARRASRVTLLVSGIPLVIKGKEY